MLGTSELERDSFFLICLRVSRCASRNLEEEVGSREPSTKKETRSTLSQLFRRDFAVLRFPEAAARCVALSKRTLLWIFIRIRGQDLGGPRNAFGDEVLRHVSTVLRSALVQSFPPINHHSLLGQPVSLIHSISNVGFLTCQVPCRFSESRAEDCRSEEAETCELTSSHFPPSLALFSFLSALLSTGHPPRYLSPHQHFHALLTIPSRSNLPSSTLVGDFFRLFDTLRSGSSNRSTGRSSPSITTQEEVFRGYRGVL